jgi:hypothetical protein
MPRSYVSGRVMSDQTEHSRAIIVSYVPSGSEPGDQSPCLLRNPPVRPQFVTRVKREPIENAFSQKNYRFSE